jgi:hypothetical protein
LRRLGKELGLAGERLGGVFRGERRLVFDEVTVLPVDAVGGRARALNPLDFRLRQPLSSRPPVVAANLGE